MSDQAPTAPAPPRLEDPEIDALVAQYHREMARFEKTALVVADRLHREIRASNLKHTLTFRAKHPDDLREKLRKKADDPRYTYAVLLPGMNSVVTDLAGCRVLLYDPADLDRVVEIARDALSLAPLPKNFERHDKPSGYRATHLLVTAPESPEHYSIQWTICEVQITTLYAHIFNELEHDVGYKDHGVPVDNAQTKLVKELLHSTVLLESSAERLMTERRRAIAATNEELSSPEELRYALESRTGRLLRGDFVRFFRLLAPLSAPLKLSLFGKLDLLYAQGERRAAEAKLSDDLIDDVVLLALGMLEKYQVEISKQLKQWRGPEFRLKVALLKACDLTSKKDHGQTDH